ncbi:hypothetical protein, partial [Streptomyces olivochromogenes]|uniref:hypothetical protein n=1 Tax=Streptomyces olivochromogenes TaxID=1963 RepID=UPI001AD7E902
MCDIRRAAAVVDRDRRSILREAFDNAFADGATGSGATRLSPAEAQARQSYDALRTAPVRTPKEDLGACASG